MKKCDHKNKTILQFVRFCIVGGTCTLIDYIVYYFANAIIPYQYAVLMGFIVSFGANYLLTTYWTFQTTTSHKNFLGMTICHLFNLIVIRIGLLSLLINILHIDKNLAYIPVLIISALSSFLILKFVFCKSNSSSICT
ncbi:MAG: GtrA family protein [Bacteroidaceae bacterium]|nr:GtrA family protein [Bacteroidaceae bacterium]